MRRFTPIALWGLFACCANPTGSAAAEWDIDPQFGNGGTADLDSADFAEVSPPLMQADGKILVCGTGISSDRLNYGEYLWRLDRGRQSRYDVRKRRTSSSRDGQLLRFLCGFGVAARRQDCAGRSHERRCLLDCPIACRAFHPQVRYGRQHRHGVQCGRGSRFDRRRQPGTTGTSQNRPRQRRRHRRCAVDLSDQIALFRLRADGTVDPAFGEHGSAFLKVPPPVEGQPYAYVSAVAFDTQRRIVVGGIRATITKHWRYGFRATATSISPLAITAPDDCVLRRAISHRQPMALQDDDGVLFGGTAYFDDAGPLTHSQVDGGETDRYRRAGSFVRKTQAWQS